VLILLATARVVILDHFNPALRVPLVHVGVEPVSRWLLLGWGVCVALHAVGWMGVKRSNGGRRDSNVAIGRSLLAALGTLLFIFFTRAEWGRGAAVTLAGVAWLVVIIALVKEGSRVGYFGHAWGLLTLLALKWCVADDAIPTLAAWGRPENDLLAPLFNMPTLVASVLAAVMIYLGRVTRDMRPFTSDVDNLVAGRVVAGLIGFAWLNFEVCRTINYFGSGQGETGLMMAKQVGLSILWAVTALAGISAGFAKDWKRMRYAALGLLGVTLVKVLLVDMAGVETIWRILSFIGVGALLLCVSFVYYRHEAASKPQFSAT
jgi:uncharacterized membrane protein